MALGVEVLAAGHRPAAPVGRTRTNRPCVQSKRQFERLVYILLTRNDIISKDTGSLLLKRLDGFAVSLRIVILVGLRKPLQGNVRRAERDDVGVAELQVALEIFLPGAASSSRMEEIRTLRRDEWDVHPEFFDCKRLCAGVESHFKFHESVVLDHHISCDRNAAYRSFSFIGRTCLG